MARRVSNTQKEDTWSWVEIGVPFPDGPVKARGANNEYVALWYKHGKPVCGRASNDGGVVQCSFPYNKVELTGKRDLGGQIQILAYDNHREEPLVWRDWGYVYRWVPCIGLPDKLVGQIQPGRRKERKQSHLAIVRCGNACPIQVPAPDGNLYMGNIDLETEAAAFAYGGKGYTITDKAQTQEFYTIVRDFSDPGSVPEPPVIDDTWVDLRENDDFACLRHPIKALDRPLKMPNGALDVYVALWYKRGQPVMGRVWKDARGKIAASFGCDGVEHCNGVGSLQVLYYNPASAGFTMKWLPYSQAAKNEWNKAEFRAVHVKGCAPCIVTDGGFEWLGKVLLHEEQASYSANGKEKVFTGPAVANFLVLCRKDK